MAARKSNSWSETISNWMPGMPHLRRGSEEQKTPSPVISDIEEDSDSDTEVMFRLTPMTKDNTNPKTCNPSVEIIGSHQGGDSQVRGQDLASESISPKANVIQTGQGDNVCNSRCSNTDAGQYPRQSTPVPLVESTDKRVARESVRMSHTDNNVHHNMGDMKRSSDIDQALSSLRFQPMTTSSRNGKPLGRKERIPDKFNGTTSEWQDYFRHFETVAGWNGWKEEERAMQLIMCLTGQAQQILGDVPAHVLNDYFTLVAELNRRFNPAERDEAYRMEFRSRRRKAGESPMEFGYALRRLASKAFPSVSCSEQEVWIIDQFATGLGSRELRKHVKFGHPKTLHAAISLAVEFETFEGSVDNYENSKPRVSGLITSVDKSTHEVDVTGTLNSKLSQLCQSIDQVVHNINTSQGNSRANNNFRRPLSDVRCYECNELGHYRTTCPKQVPNNVPRVNHRPKQHLN